VTFGLGASVGPLIASSLMQALGDAMLYVFMGVCAFGLLIALHFINSRQKSERQVSGDYVMGGGDLVLSPYAAAIDPRVDMESVQDQMINPHEEEINAFEFDDEMSDYEPIEDDFIDDQSEYDIEPNSKEA
jgi:hypothetical protein